MSLPKKPAPPRTGSSAAGADDVRSGPKSGVSADKGGSQKSSTPRLTLVNGRKVYTSAAEPLRITRDQIEKAVASLKK